MNDPHQPGDPAKQKPKQQTGEQFGSVRGPQLTDATMREKDLARGSETDTAGAAGNRRKAS